MRSEGFLQAERALAQHSERLARRAPGPDELASALAAVAPRLEQALAGELAALLGGDRPQVTSGKVERAAAPRLHKLIDPVAVNWAFADAGGAQLLVSLNVAGAMALTDLLFGGPGLPPPTLPERLPKSTDLALERVAASLGAALGTALERAGPLALTMRSEVLGKLVPARDDDTFLTLRCLVAQGAGAPVELLLLLRLGEAAKLLGDGGAGALPSGATPEYRATVEPFASLPLPLVAVLAELTLPVRRITALKVGDVIPLSVPRELTLRLAGKPIARGEAGTAEGQLALRLTQTEWTKKDMTNG